jgi:histidyl-tRNA synthetase
VSVDFQQETKTDLSVVGVGISFGVDRIITILKAKNAGSLTKNDMQVYVMAFGVS